MVLSPHTADTAGGALVLGPTSGRLGPTSGGGGGGVARRATRWSEPGSSCLCGPATAESDVPDPLSGLVMMMSPALQNSLPAEVRQSLSNRGSRLPSSSLYAPRGGRQSEPGGPWPGSSSCCSSIRGGLVEPCSGNVTTNSASVTHRRHLRTIAKRSLFGTVLYTRSQPARQLSGSWSAGTQVGTGYLTPAGGRATPTPGTSAAILRKGASSSSDLPPALLHTPHTHQQALSDSQHLLQLISASVEAQGWGPLSSSSSAPGSPPVGVMTVQWDAVSTSLSPAPGPCAGQYAALSPPTYPADDRPMGQRSDVQINHSLYRVSEAEATVTASAPLPLMGGGDWYSGALLGGKRKEAEPLRGAPGAGSRMMRQVAAGGATAVDQVSSTAMLWEDEDLVVCGSDGSSSSGQEAPAVDPDPGATLDPDPGTTLDGLQQQQANVGNASAAAAAVGVYVPDWDM